MTGLRRALAAALLLAGCRLLPHAPNPALQEGEWAERRDAVTRSADLYDGFEHRASIWTVRLTPEVREARARRLAAWLSWTSAELEKRLGEERAEAAATDEFVVFLYTADRTWNDLDAPRSIWRVELDMGGDEVVAGRIESIGRDATFDALFPMGGHFDTAYRLRFPRQDREPAPLPAVLRFASALGEVLLAYTPGSKPARAPEPGG